MEERGLGTAGPPEGLGTVGPPVDLPHHTCGFYRTFPVQYNLEMSRDRCHLKQLRVLPP